MTVETAAGPMDLCSACRTPAVTLISALADAGPLTEEEAEDLIDRVHDQLALDGVVDLSITGDGDEMIIYMDPPE